MASVSKTISTSALRHEAPGLAADFAELLRALKALFDPYRPELHYMRGPGPKWHAKNDPAPFPADSLSFVPWIDNHAPLASKN
jgi:hypothetical protein